MTFAQPFREYEILDRVGAGAMGTVFKARHGKLGRIVALKVLRPSLARDKRYVDRLRREARIVAALNHPNIVTGYDLGEEGGYHYFVMEFVEGRSLRSLLTEWGIFPEDQVLNVAIQVAAALDHAFQRGVIHRDIKPGNILIDEAGAVKVTDMGLAKGPADLALTRDGSTVGTPQYISPEQARNPQDADVRSDLYSLGATLYHMATGQPPFQGTSLAEVITQVLNDSPVAPRVINRDLSEGMALVIRKLLAKSPKLRYQTPRELLDDLDRVKKELPPQVDESRLSTEDTDRQPALLRWSLAIVGAGALIAFGYWLGLGRGDLPTTPGTPDAFVAALRVELDAMDTPGQQWLRYLARTKDAPFGGSEARLRLQRELVADLQTAVDTLIAELRSSGFARIAADVRDPQRWPEAAVVVRDHVGTLLQSRVGLLQDQLPNGVVATELDRLLNDIDQLVRQRDRALVDRARLHLEVELPLRAEERVRQRDFSGAERLWREGFVGFFDGLRQPLPERLATPQRQALEDKFERLRTVGLAQLDAAEQLTLAALRFEAAEGARTLRAGLAAAADLDGELRRVLLLASRFREQLAAAYPQPGRFRAATDPWQEIAAAATALEREVDERLTAAIRRHENQLADLAWRAFVDGDAAAGLSVLPPPSSPGADQVDWTEAHRTALRAADAVARACVEALQKAAPPIPGYPRNGGVPVELRAGADGRLDARAVGGTWRQVQLQEFRFGDLLQRAMAASPERMQAIPADDLRIGRTVLAMACDQLDVLAADLPAGDRTFLRDDVWPRLLRMRNEPSGRGEERAVALQRLREAHTRAITQRDLRELEAVLTQWQMGFASDASAAERSIATEAAHFISREGIRQLRQAELTLRAPADSTVTVVDQGNSLQSEVQIPAPALRNAGDGWQLRSGRLEYACAVPRWRDVREHRLDVDPGFGPAVADCSAELEFAMPAITEGQRLYVLQFHGIACVVFATADDRWLAGIVEGDALKAQDVAAALQRAVHATADRRGASIAGSAAAGGAEQHQGRPSALPLAVHRLRFSLQCAPSRRTAAAVVTIDGAELCRQFVPFEQGRSSGLLLYPMQELSVRSVRFRAID